MQQLITIIMFLIFLSILIVIHELGHFLTAKAFGVYCHEFSLGMGPLVAQKKIGETKFSLRAIPIGGYVAMAGESEIPDAPALPRERTLVGIARWKRAIVLAAGIVLNLVLAYVILVGFILNTGLTQEASYVNVSPNSLLANAGVQTGDRITAAQVILTAADGTTVLQNTTDASITTYIEFVELLTIAQPSAVNQQQCLILTIEGKTSPVMVCRTITTFTTNEQGQVTEIAPLIGVSPTTRAASWGESLVLAGQVEWEMGTMIFAGLGGLFAPGGFDNVAGPIGMVQASTDFIDLGVWYYLYFWAIISVNLAVFNILPIPGLDGARLLMTAVEGITRKPINPKVEMMIHAIGFLFLIGLMIAVTFKDLFTWLG